MLSSIPSPACCKLSSAQQRFHFPECKSNSYRCTYVMSSVIYSLVLVLTQSCHALVLVLVLKKSWSWSRYTLVSFMTLGGLAYNTLLHPIKNN